ncbi:MAG: DUF494 domain-containing protein [Burkholderiales bacterium]|nr:DUF494 domain-containing protein [Burkholderiales bacterium]
MFQVLVFVYENYWRGDACPEPEQLGRKLSAVGFEQEEIREALIWLDDLRRATMPVNPAAAEGGTHYDTVIAASPESLRVYSVAEQDHLGAECLGFLSFLSSAGILSPQLLEIVIDRAMAARGGPVAADELKIIVLMVYWSSGLEPDSLVLDELCDDTHARVAH